MHSHIVSYLKGKKIKLKSIEDQFKNYKECLIYK